MSKIKLVLMVLLTVLLMSVLLVGACAKPAPEVPIKIGVALELTGFLAAEGEFIRKGVVLGFEEANYKVAGKPIKVIIEDNASDPNVTLEKFKKLVEWDKVHMTIGGLHTGNRLSAAAYHEKVKIPNLAVMANVIEEIKFDWNFQVPTTFLATTMPLGWNLYDEKGYRTMTTVGMDYAAGYEGIGGVVKGFEEKRGKVLLQQWTPPDTIDFGPYLSAMPQADVCLVWIAGPGMLQFLTQYKEFGFFKKMPLAVAWNEGIFEQHFAALGDALLGVRGAAEYTWRIDNPINKKFVAAYRNKYKENPSAYSAGGYTSALVALAVLEATGGDTNPGKLYTAILGVKLETPSGPYYMTPQRLGVKDIYITEVQKIDGKPVWEPIRRYQEVRRPGY